MSASPVKASTLIARNTSAEQVSTSFRRVLHAEWTKFRTVRGWIVGMLLVPLLTAGIALLNRSSCGGTVTPGGRVVAGLGCTAPIGPGGEAVTDSFYLVHQPLAGDGSITARLASLTGQNLQPWAKAGVIVKASTRAGSAYAAVMLTGSHGVRMQYDYTADIDGNVAGGARAVPHWLRLTRAGTTLTGYESANGTHWTLIGTAVLPALPRTVQAGLFATSPAGSAHVGSQSITGSSTGAGLTLATASFTNVSLRSGSLPGALAGAHWAGAAVGGMTPGEGFRQAGDTVTVAGTGDIAPDVPAAPGNSGGTPPEQTLEGTFGGLIAVIIVAVMFMTAEYRRNLVRVTFSASPGRGAVLAAKAIVAGASTFVAGLAGAGIAIPAGEALLRSNGNSILPIGLLTQVRLVAGTAALLAVMAVLAVALGAVLRHSAAAITAIVMTMVLPYFLAAQLPLLPAGTADWLLRVTPAAAFAVQQTTPQYAQVAGSYTPANGYFPLPPWAGFAVLCGYAAATLALAAVLLRRRDA
jgi:ABC-2 family transporter protein